MSVPALTNYPFNFFHCSENGNSDCGCVGGRCRGGTAQKSFPQMLSASLSVSHPRFEDCGFRDGRQTGSKN